ncbi:retrovirus-related pol polyprotein from transposon TNT 1-94 [Tanacetum coccineum]
MSSSSSSSHATITYTSVSSDDDLPSWSIPLMDAYEPEAPLSPVHALVWASVKEEEELSAPADSPPVGLYIDLPSEVEEDEVPSTPPLPTSHHHIIPLSQTGLRRVRMSVQPQTPLPPSIDALIEEWRTAPTPPSPSPSPLSTLSSLLLDSITTITTTINLPVGIIPKADMPLRKKDRFPAQSQRFKESVTDIAARHSQDSEEFYTCHQDAQDDRCDSGCSRHMTGVKQYLHRYSKESSPKVVFGDNSSGDTKVYGSVNYNGITFTRIAYVNGLKHNLISISQLCDANVKVLFTKTQGTIFNQNKKVVLIAPRIRDVYVIDMSSYNEEINACFFTKASNSVNWIWHKRLSHLNFKNFNKLARQNLLAGFPSLTFSKDKTCSACEKGKHHRASFKTK